MSEDGLGWKLEARPFVTGCSIDWADAVPANRNMLNFHGETESGRKVQLSARPDGVYAGGGFIILFK